MSVNQDALITATEQLSLKDKLKHAPKFYIGKIEFKFDPDELSSEMQARAAKELRETPENIEEALKILREHIKGEPDLKVPTDQEHLQKFLRPCKWYPDSAFELMKRFYKYRANHPRYCANLQPSNEHAVLMSGTLTPFPKRCDDGVRVILIEGGRKWKPKELSLDQMFRGVILFLEAAMAEPISQVAGVRVLIDMDGLTLTHVTYFTPSFAAAVVDFVQRCLPCRLKGVHIINQPFIFNMVFAFFKPFLQEKLRKRIHFHGTDRNSLKKFIDAACLPERYGGELEFPNEPLGEPFIKFLSTFEDDFNVSTKHGYINKS
ncbi:alpha-tocopherol transfer protein-like [Phymastichus coffea]|uniref:alpha-tocopherol transfer protein-like n=1 Tax=Phymastichus coffea TaxID=108790 RepID=UPI00273AAA20|nr:alpha-tocopherol transfer protein-like [Phymastichus coffea]XP_058795507.1 alpha-tocopherol transfer protein-like [Phymastichus coffea]XP_058795508.1 alpha-tocopherol transfer protein-like [Phymastichus coffea]XP_058795509.1 alpha-tocopherol transfer protein-like [Phymastichus coffea]